MRWAERLLFQAAMKDAIGLGSPYVDMSEPQRELFRRVHRRAVELYGVERA
jgi:hypothetical protein